MGKYRIVKHKKGEHIYYTVQEKHAVLWLLGYWHTHTERVCMGTGLRRDKTFKSIKKANEFIGEQKCLDIETVKTIVAYE